MESSMGTTTQVQSLSLPFCSLPCQFAVPAAAPGVPKESSRTVLPVVVLRILPHSCGAARTAPGLSELSRTQPPPAAAAPGQPKPVGQASAKEPRGGNRARGQSRVGPQLLLPLIGRPDLALPAPTFTQPLPWSLRCLWFCPPSNHLPPTQEAMHPGTPLNPKTSPRLFLPAGRKLRHREEGKQQTPKRRHLV